MTRRWVFSVAVWLLGLTLGTGLGIAIGQQAPPTKTKGVDVKALGTIDLGPDIPGYQFRLRLATFEPGAVFAVHSHKERPGFAYILDGTLTAFFWREGLSRPGEYKKEELGPGGFMVESRDLVSHWVENRGTTKVVLLAVDIIKP